MDSSDRQPAHGLHLLEMSQKHTKNAISILHFTYRLISSVYHKVISMTAHILREARQDYICIFVHTCSENVIMIGKNNPVVLGSFLVQDHALHPR